MTNPRDFIAPMFVDIDDCMIEPIAVDFRGKKWWSGYTLEQIKMTAELEMEEKRNFWLAISIIFSILTALTLWGLWF